MSSHQSVPNQFVEAKGVKYAYRRLGPKGRVPVVFLMHFRGCMDLWDPAIVNGFAASRDVILFDNAGVGYSTGQISDTIEAMSEHVIAFLAALGLQTVDLLGFSMGGFVAQMVTLEQPELVRKLILAGTGPSAGDGIEAAVEGHPNLWPRATADDLDESTITYLFFAPNEEGRAFGKVYWDRIHDRKKSGQKTASYVTGSGVQAQMSALIQWSTNRDKGSYGRLNNIKQPVLIVNGYDDIMVPTVNSYTMFRKLPDARLYLYPDSGHGAPFQFAEHFVPMSLQFLEE
ncbi:hydrolase, alpha/beta fold family [Xylogone sp. PMI_703]|nr:hydrolase, alpha/beta fold family [Xylogone sp. PMI_703]